MELTKITWAKAITGVDVFQEEMVLDAQKDPIREAHLRSSEPRKWRSTSLATMSPTWLTTDP